ncbi:archaeal proteasome endopeptidase complex subunit beta [Halosimplex sp. TS25]|uniref:archaeal proteasome endopeptidase complex subunit beta n=1 Tax=Halosimplex rarum TaxID=3396619 RepID=UPI0039E8FBAD
MSRFTDPLTGADAIGDPTEPELGAGQFDGANAGGDAQARDDESVNKTGTTTVGISTDEGVVVATDMRASLGGRFVSNKSVQKVEQIHPTGVLTLVGSVGGAQSFIRTLRSEVDLYEVRKGEPISMHALATLAGNFARGGPWFAINPILGGVDDEGSHVYSIDPAGGVMKDDYTVTGSGMQLAHGAIEGVYDREMSLDDARDLAVRAVEAASERDTGSGNGVYVATVTGDGVEIEGFDETEDAFAQR